MADILDLVGRGLSVGQEFTAGSDRYRIETAAARLRSLSSGRFAPKATLLAEDVARRLKERDDILKDLASHLVVLLTKSLHDLTAHQYATLKELAAAGHPYAKNAFRDARGRVNPRLKSARAALRKVGTLSKSPGNAINSQSFGPANLDASFVFTVTQTPGGVYSVLATSPLAYSWMLADGTNSMVARPFDRDAARAAQTAIADDVRAAAAKLAVLGESVPGLKAPEIDFNLGGKMRAYK